jgi:hypothetical protein
LNFLGSKELDPPQGTQRRRGLINFNVTVLKDGIRRIVNDFPDSLHSALCGEIRIWRLNAIL